MAAPVYSYRYVAAFPRHFDEARPYWPLELLEQILALPDAVDATFPDYTVAWRPGVEAGVALRESRRRTIELVTSSPSQARADAARAAFLALLRGLKGPTDRIVVTRESLTLDVL
jgi:hypothetical protein